MAGVLDREAPLTISFWLSALLYLLMHVIFTESSVLQLKGCSPPRESESSHQVSSVESANEIVHIKAHTPAPTYYSINSSSYHYDHNVPGPEDKSAKLLEKGDVSTASAGYSRLVSMSGAAAACGLITELNVCDFAHQIASGLQHLESLNVSAMYTPVVFCWLLILHIQENSPIVLSFWDCRPCTIFINRTTVCCTL